MYSRGTQRVPVHSSHKSPTRGKCNYLYTLAGITDSKGVVYDFQGPSMIGRDHMMLGAATRYIQLDPSKVLNSDLGDGDGDGAAYEASFN